ncbi:MAG: thioredoxin domain-containing protein [Methanolinea sp.]|nr:thioredoxin domain-containing protein [Methanolinea sp.]
MSDPMDENGERSPELRNKNEGTPNRLVREVSPYLLQHAYNPVDWYPWGEEAFSRAKDEEKPIFLSIGYSTCHWCHVMERESFSDPEVGRMLNEHFVCIKVDREERPEIDQLYMRVSQALTGTGGWPLTIVMTPDRLPFFAATYLPKESRFGMPGLLDILPRLAAIWEKDRDRLVSTAEGIAKSLSSQPGKKKGKSPGKDTAGQAFKELLLSYDRITGGFGPAPRFPMFHLHLFLLWYSKWTGNLKAREMAEHTLLSMARGGIHDWLGSGFHRYSTDTRWLVPHFEKMLYDQSMAVMAYTEAFLASGRLEFKDVAMDCLNYMREDMRSPDGAFFSAEDADSEGEEGKYYLWTRQEMADLLDPDQARVAFQVFRISTAGNFLDPASGERSGKNILAMIQTREEAAKTLSLSLDHVRETLEGVKSALSAARMRRIRPFRDEKVLTDWNGLAIGAFARAGRVFQNPDCLDAAERAVDFVMTRMKQDDSGLLHRYRDGTAGIPGMASDYATMTAGLIDLYLASSKPRYLGQAIEFQEILDTRFLDKKNGGYFTAPGEGTDLFTRTKEFVDGALPSPNSVIFNNLVRLGYLTGDVEYTRRADSLSLSYASFLDRSPSSCGMFLAGLVLAISPATQVVISGSPEDKTAIRMLSFLRTQYLPLTTWHFRMAGAAGEELAGLAPFLRKYPVSASGAAAYVCTRHACRSPVADMAALAAALGLPEATPLDGQEKRGEKGSEAL